MTYNKFIMLLLAAVFSLNGFSQNKKPAEKAKTVVEKTKPTDKPISDKNKTELEKDKASLERTKQTLDKITADKNKPAIEKPLTAAQRLDSLKNALVKTDAEETDTLANAIPLKFKPFKKSAHASYYHDKFTGKRTASGQKFDNKKYTAAHRKLPFGTKLKITNEKTGKSVVVEVTDRGPFSRGREIDLTKKAFMEIADNKNSGSLTVTIEEEVKK